MFCFFVVVLYDLVQGSLLGRHRESESGITKKGGLIRKRGVRDTL